MPAGANNPMVTHETAPNNPKLLETLENKSGQLLRMTITIKENL